MALAFSFPSTRRAVHQIMKMELNGIKIKGAIKGLKWAEWDLKDLDY